MDMYDLENLPGELIITILNDLDLIDFSRLMCSCKRYRDLFGSEFSELFSKMGAWEDVMYKDITSDDCEYRQDLDFVDLYCYLLSTPNHELTKQIMYNFDICLGDHLFEQKSALYGNQMELFIQIYTYKDLETQFHLQKVCCLKNNYDQFIKLQDDKPDNRKQMHHRNLVYAYVFSREIFDYYISKYTNVYNYDKRGHLYLTSIGYGMGDLTPLLLLNDDIENYKKMTHWYRGVLRVTDWSGMYKLLYDMLEAGAEKCITYIIEEIDKTDIYGGQSAQHIYHFIYDRACGCGMDKIKDLLEPRILPLEYFKDIMRYD